jgi:hypothetical protein
VNPLILAAAADRIASVLSLDAAGWRPQCVRAAPDTPVALDVAFVGGAPSYGPGLLEALRLRLAAPYTTRDPAGGAAIVAAGPRRPADVEVALRAEARGQTPGIAYELTFRDSGAVRAGWIGTAA